MLRFIACFLTLLATNTAFAADASTTVTRPISTAESILAVYYEDFDNPLDGPRIIFVAWPDGHLVWSFNQSEGGPPYRTGQIEPKRIADLFERFDSDGLFSQDDLNRAHFGPDSDFVTLYIKHGKQSVKMASWHEGFENAGRTVATQHGISGLDRKKRLAVLRDTASKEYLFYRLVWSELRGKLAQLVPCGDKPSSGKAVMNRGEISWQE
jgi:hypothetical protein